jgi:homoserine O-acetyltransferase/O-succinyltransferase
MSTNIHPSTSSTTTHKQIVNYETKYYYHNQPLVLESGAKLYNPRIAYHTFGTLNAKRDNVVWIIHALTGNSNPLEWWPDMVGSGCVVDPSKYFIICANALGSPYGSTCPLDFDSENGKVYYHDFPLLTIKDLIKGYQILATYLGIDSIRTLIGASIGGQQALEWSITHPDFVKNLLLIATSAYSSPWVIAFNETQRMAIRSDQTWTNGGKNAAIEGLKSARAIAMLSYRHPLGYAETQSESESKYDDYRASSYQRYQGLKLANRFNAYSYYLMTQAMDSHDVGRGRESRVASLAQVKANTGIVSINNDLLFIPEDQKYIADHIENSTHYTLESNFGHDGFLVERQEIARIIDRYLAT